MPIPLASRAEVLTASALRNDSVGQRRPVCRSPVAGCRLPQYQGPGRIQFPAPGRAVQRTHAWTACSPLTGTRTCRSLLHAASLAGARRGAWRRVSVTRTASASYGGALAQPVLAVTSLAYVAAGMAVLCWAMRLRAPLAGTAGVALVAVGAGSFAYHGPQPSWAEPAHDWPIVAVGSGVRRRSCPEPAPAVAVGLGGSGRGLRAGTGRLRRRTLRVAALPTRQPLAVPRRLARPLCRCRRMGGPRHGAGPTRERKSSMKNIRRPVGTVSREPLNMAKLGSVATPVEFNCTARPGKFPEASNISKHAQDDS